MTDAATTYDVAELELAAIDATPDNREVTRDRVPGLAASIARLGLMQPLEVYDTGGGRYVLRAGHHRRAALELLGRTVAPCIVVAAPADDADRHARRCASNWARVETRPADDFAELSRLLEAGSSMDDLRAVSGHSETWIRNRLALGTLDPAVRWIATRHGITWATALAGLPGAAQRALARALDETKPSRDRWNDLLERSRRRAAELEAEQGAMFALEQQTWDTERARYVDELGASAEPVPTSAPPLPLGLEDVAARLGVKRDTVQKWRQRSTGFPAPAGEISGNPWWWAADVDRWAAETGRA